MFGRIRAVALAMLAGASAWGAAQTCTTQAAMAPAMRTAIATAAMSLASAVQAGRPEGVRALTDTGLIGDFGGTEYLVRSTAPRLAGDALSVTQVYLLDASARKPGDASSADFTCPLGGTTSEADFSINGLPPGKFAFAMVEAGGGARPWLLAFLLHEDAGAWKMAGFYPHARTAAGHDGLWYWTTARARVKAGQKWSGWLMFSEADQLLRPAGFLLTTHLDKLRSEQTEAAPPELSNGVNANAPLVITGKGGEFHVTLLTTEASDDGKQVNVMLHMKVDSVGDAAAARARNAAAAAAFVDAHPEVRKDFHSVWVFAEAQGQPPFATEHPMVEVP
jgi:hypothetical protein